MRALTSLVLASTSLIACGSDGIDSDEEARRAYLALDESIAKSLQLGFDGFNEASSANIAPQITVGDGSGELTITGQVDQGASANKGMRLRVGMVDYTDGEILIDPDGDDTFLVVFDTDAEPANQPSLDLMMMNIPTGTLQGTLTGTYVMDGDLEGVAELDLTFSGQLQEDGAGGVERVPGTTTVTGTATTDDDGVFDVDITL